MVFWEGSLHLEDEVPKCILLLPKNTEMFIPLFFWGPPFFLRMDCGLSSFFLKDGGGPRGPKKRGMHPSFLFFYGLRLQGLWLGSQHPSPNVRNPLRIQAANWLEIITSRDARSACFQGSQTSCAEIISVVFLPKFGRKRSHHGMDAPCWLVWKSQSRNYRK